MGIKRYELSEAQWARIAPLLPGKAADPGRTGSDTQALVEQVRLGNNRIEIDCSTAAVADALGGKATDDAPPTLTFITELTLTRSGRAMRLVQSDGTAATRTANPALLRLLIRARRWWRMLREGELDITALAQAEGVKPAYITRVVRLAFLSPAVTEAILKGTTRAEVSSTTITAPEAIPACWRAQGKAMLPVAAMVTN